MSSHELCFPRVSAGRDPVTGNERKGRQPVEGEEADQRSCGSGQQAGGSAGEWWSEIDYYTLLYIQIIHIVIIHPKLINYSNIIVMLYDWVPEPKVHIN